MRRRLFLTGTIGCGKSTAILTAIGDNLPNFGGFLTKRIRDGKGHAAAFTLCAPDGSREEVFLDCTPGKPVIHWEVFQTLAPKLMTGKIVILDEIGGMELLCPEFMDALNALLETDIPIIGVLKGDTAANAMIRKLGLSAEYEAAAHALRDRLLHDENTLLYTCGQYDSHALELARAWVKEYAHD